MIDDKAPVWAWNVWVGTVCVLILAGIWFGSRVESQAEPNGFKPIEAVVRANEEQRIVRVGPGIAWSIESSQPFLAYTVSDGSGIKTDLRKVPAGFSEWSGDLRDGDMIIRGIENDTKMTFVFKEVGQ